MIDKSKMEQAASLFEQCSPLFMALGDNVRQKLIMFLMESGFEGINVGNLASKTHLSRPAVSHHLKILKDAGVKRVLKVFIISVLVKNFLHFRNLFFRSIPSLLN